MIKKKIVTDSTSDLSNDYLVENNGKEVKNKDIWIELLELIKKFDDLEIIKVKAHATNEGNNEVDQLVNDTMDRMG